MKYPRDFPIAIPPGGKSLGINLAALGGKAPTPATPKAKGKAGKGADVAAIEWPILALDASSSATGWARQTSPGDPPTFGLIKPPSSRPSIARIDWTVEAMGMLIRAAPPALVVMEWADGHTAGRLAKANGLSVLGAAQGAIRQAIIGAGIRVEAIPQNLWSRSKPKKSRAKMVRLAYPEYARWADDVPRDGPDAAKPIGIDEGRDKGLDVCDALGILAWRIANVPTV